MLHIVFDKEGAEALAASFELDEGLSGEIIYLNDDWSIGPLLGTINSVGQTINRSEWLAKFFKSGTSEQSDLDTIKKYLRDNPESDAWMWIAPNPRDVCGYYYLISNLYGFSGRICTLWLNNLPFISEKGFIFYPHNIGEIPAREFVKAKKLAQQVSPATFETDPDEWKKMQKENSVLRVLEGGKKVVAKAETFFDKDLVDSFNNDWLKSSKIIQQFNVKSKVFVNKTFLLWRLRELIQKEVLEAKGDWPGSDSFEIRKKQKVQLDSADD